MPQYKIYIPEDKEWCKAEAPGVEEACAIFGVRSSKVFVYGMGGKNPKLVCKPSAEQKRSCYLGGK